MLDIINFVLLAASFIFTLIAAYSFWKEEPFIGLINTGLSATFVFGAMLSQASSLSDEALNVAAYIGWAGLGLLFIGLVGNLVEMIVASKQPSTHSTGNNVVKFRPRKYHNR